MKKLAQQALWPNEPPTVNLTTSTSNIGKISTPNVHDESKLQLCVLNTQSICNNRMNSLTLYFKTIWNLSPYQTHGSNLLMTWYPVSAPLLATLSIISPDQKRQVEGLHFSLDSVYLSV